MTRDELLREMAEPVTLDTSETAKLNAIGERFRAAIANQSFDGHALFMSHFPVDERHEAAAVSERHQRMTEIAERTPPDRRGNGE